MTLSSFIRSVADLLRGDSKESEYGKASLGFFALRRFDCVLEEIRVGYEIPFHRHVHVVKPPRSFEQIDSELKSATSSSLALIGGRAE